MGATPSQLLDKGSLNNISNALAEAKVGSGLRLVPRTVSAAVSSDKITLAETAKAVAVLSAFATAAGTAGYKTVVKTGATPGAGEVGIDNQGNILFAAADTVTAAEVVYVMIEGGAIIEETIPVTANVGTLLQGRQGVLLLSAVATAGGVTGTGLVKARAASVANTTHFVCLSLLGTTVIWNAGDAVTECTVRYIAYPGVGAGTEDSFASLLDTEIGGLPTV